MGFGIGPWQRVALCIGSAACVLYAVLRYLDGEGFFLQSVVGFIGIFMAMTPPRPGSVRWPERPSLSRLNKRVVLGTVAVALASAIIWAGWMVYSNRRQAARDASDQAIQVENRRRSQVVVRCPSGPPPLPDWMKDEEQRQRVLKRYDAAAGGSPAFAALARERENQLLFEMENGSTPKDVAIAIRTIRGMGELDPSDDRRVQERTWTLCQNGYKKLLEGPPL